MKETVKTFRTLLAEGKKGDAEALVPALYKSIDKATKRGVVKKNTANRKKSRLMAALKRVG